MSDAGHNALTDGTMSPQDGLSTVLSDLASSSSSYLQPFSGTATAAAAGATVGPTRLPPITDMLPPSHREQFVLQQRLLASYDPVQKVMTMRPPPPPYGAIATSSRKSAAMTSRRNSSNELATMSGPGHNALTDGTMSPQDGLSTVLSDLASSSSSYLQPFSGTATAAAAGATVGPTRLPPITDMLPPSHREQFVLQQRLLASYDPVQKVMTMRPPPPPYGAIATSSRKSTAMPSYCNSSNELATMSGPGHNALTDGTMSPQDGLSTVLSDLASSSSSYLQQFSGTATAAAAGATVGPTRLPPITDMLPPSHREQLVLQQRLLASYDLVQKVMTMRPPPPPYGAIATSSRKSTAMPSRRNSLNKHSMTYGGYKAQTNGTVPLQNNLSTVKSSPAVSSSHSQQSSGAVMNTAQYVIVQPARIFRSNVLPTTYGELNALTNGTVPLQNNLSTVQSSPEASSSNSQQFSGAVTTDAKYVIVQPARQIWLNIIPVMFGGYINISDGTMPLQDGLSAEKSTLASTSSYSQQFSGAVTTNAKYVTAQSAYQFGSNVLPTTYGDYNAEANGTVPLQDGLSAEKSILASSSSYSQQFSGTVTTNAKYVTAQSTYQFGSNELATTYGGGCNAETDGTVSPQDDLSTEMLGPAASSSCLQQFSGTATAAAVGATVGPTRLPPIADMLPPSHREQLVLQQRMWATYDLMRTKQTVMKTSPPYPPVSDHGMPPRGTATAKLKGRSGRSTFSTRKRTAVGCQVHEDALTDCARDVDVADVAAIYKQSEYASYRDSALERMGPLECVKRRARDDPRPADPRQQQLKMRKTNREWARKTDDAKRRVLAEDQICIEYLTGKVDIMNDIRGQRLVHDVPSTAAGACNGSGTGSQERSPLPPTTK